MKKLIIGILTAVILTTSGWWYKLDAAETACYSAKEIAKGVTLVIMVDDSDDIATWEFLGQDPNTGMYIYLAVRWNHALSESGPVWCMGQDKLVYVIFTKEARDQK